jgi:protein tyrosine phosphatase (PTP) superfamily phosphohydrolase (DUF442 family)
MRPLRCLPTLLAAVIALLLAGCYQSKLGVAVPGIDNFGVVEGKSCLIYRGAQPEKEGIVTLREKGVRTIINLRNDPDPREEEWAKAAGMRYVNIPSNPLSPKLPDVQKYLQIVGGQPAAPFVSEPVEGPIFVHCYAGRDRTGLFVAAYRVAEQDWPTDQAIHEFDAYGHNRLLFPQIHQFLRKTPTEELIRRDGDHSPSKSSSISSATL